MTPLLNHPQESLFEKKSSSFGRESAIEKLQVKDLRRLAEHGANMHDIQQVLGHASVATTERHYAQFSPDHSAKKILKVLEGGRSEMETKRKQPLSHLEGMG